MNKFVLIAVAVSAVVCLSKADGQQKFWEPTSGPYGGPVYSIFKSPTGTLFANAGGIYHSTNSGKTWTLVNTPNNDFCVLLGIDSSGYLYSRLADNPRD